MTASVIVDLIFLFLFVTFCLRGAFKGLSGEVFSLLGTIGGIVLAWKFTKPVTEVILDHVSFSPPVVFIAVMVLLYILAAVLAACMCKIVKALIRFTQLSLLDRFLGVLAGGAITTAIILFLYLASISFSSFFPGEWLSGSLTMKIASNLWPHVESVLIQMNLLNGSFENHLL